MTHEALVPPLGSCDTLSAAGRTFRTKFEALAIPASARRLRRRATYKEAADDPRVDWYNLRKDSPCFTLDRRRALQCSPYPPET